jgi:hypothetical protein
MPPWMTPVETRPSASAPQNSKMAASCEAGHQGGEGVFRGGVQGSGSSRTDEAPASCASSADCASSATHDDGLPQGQGLGADGGAECVGDVIRA